MTPQLPKKDVPSGARDKFEARGRMILDHAHAKFLRLGIRNVSMDDIARDLHMSKKTLYVHFTSKEDLVWHCVLRITDALLPEVMELLQNNGSIRERLMGLQAVLHKFPTLVSSEFLKTIRIDYPHIWEEADKRRQIVFDGICDLILEGQKKGDIRPEIHPEVAVKIIRAIQEHVLIPETFLDGRLSPMDVVHTFTAIFFNGLLTQPAGETQPAGAKETET